jgi:hypothetical protein
MAKSGRFNTRAFTSLYMVISGLFIAATGLVLYLAPAGRVAHWVEWRFIFLTKEQWQAVHTIFSFIFVIAVVLHLYFNWAILWSYLKNRMKAGVRMKRELGTAALFTLAVFGLTLFGIPPFKTVMDFGIYLTDSWATEQTEPPVPHAEELTLVEFAGATGIELEKAMAHLAQSGIEGVDSLVTMGYLSEMNGTTPKELSDLLGEVREAGQGSAVSGIAGVGYGRMTISQVVEREGLELSAAMERLSSAGIRAGKKDNLRTLATDHGLTPLELVDIMKGS